MDFVLPPQAVSVVLKDVRDFGALGVETGGFLLKTRGETEVVSVVALAGKRGIEREALYFSVSGLAVEELSDWADSSDLVIIGQFHSHGRGAFLSLIDETGGYRVEDFVSIVVPYFAEPPQEPASWGWYEFRQGCWQPKDSAPLSDGTIDAITFDEDGVR